MVKADEQQAKWRTFLGPALIILMATSTVVLVVLAVTKVKESLYGINLVETTCEVKSVCEYAILCSCVGLSKILFSFL